MSENETNNSTLALVSEYSRDQITERLICRIGDLIDDNEEIATGHIIAALVQLLLQEQIIMNVNDDGSICVPCANESLTELLQTIRTLHSDTINDMPKETH